MSEGKPDPSAEELKERVAEIREQTEHGKDLPDPMTAENTPTKKPAEGRFGTEGVDTADSVAPPRQNPGE